MTVLRVSANLIQPILKWMATEWDIFNEYFQVSWALGVGATLDNAVDTAMRAPITLSYALASTVGQ